MTRQEFGEFVEDLVHIANNISKKKALQLLSIQIEILYINRRKNRYEKRLHKLLKRTEVIHQDLTVLVFQEELNDLA